MPIIIIINLVSYSCSWTNGGKIIWWHYYSGLWNLKLNFVFGQGAKFALDKLERFFPDKDEGNWEELLMKCPITYNPHALLYHG